MSLARRLSGLVLTALALVMLAVLVLPSLFGWTSLVVTSGSMSPTFDTGSVVVIKPIEAEAVRVRDIVSFRDASGGFTTHRVIGMSSSVEHGQNTLSFITKGDANEDADPQELVTPNLVGKAAFAVPHLGYLVTWIKTPLGAGGLAALLLFVVFTSRGPGDVATREPSQQREAVPVP